MTMRFMSSVRMPIAVPLSEPAGNENKEIRVRFQMTCNPRAPQGHLLHSERLLQTIIVTPFLICLTSDHDRTHDLLPLINSTPVHSPLAHMLLKLYASVTVKVSSLPCQHSLSYNSRMTGRTISLRFITLELSSVQYRRNIRLRIRHSRRAIDNTFTSSSAE